MTKKETPHEPGRECGEEVIIVLMAI